MKPVDKGYAVLTGSNSELVNKNRGWCSMFSKKKCMLEV